MNKNSQGIERNKSPWLIQMRGENQQNFFWDNQVVDLLNNEL